MFFNPKNKNINLSLDLLEVRADFMFSAENIEKGPNISHFSMLFYLFLYIFVRSDPDLIKRNADRRDHDFPPEGRGGRFVDRDLRLLPRHVAGAGVEAADEEEPGGLGQAIDPRRRA